MRLCFSSHETIVRSPLRALAARDIFVFMSQTILTLDPDLAPIITPAAMRQARNVLRRRVRRRLYASSVHDYFPHSNIIAKIRAGKIIALTIEVLEGADSDSAIAAERDDLK